jgi:uncharacterized membrane protein
MIEKNGPTTTALELALGAVFAALVFVATYSFRIPIPATNGYFNLGETTIYVAALLFGPFVGAVAGFGAGIADIVLGYAQYAPGTFLIKGIEGAAVGFLYFKLQKHLARHSLSAFSSVAVGGSLMILGYFIYEQIILRVPVLAAFAEIPFNIIQVLAGIVVAIPIVNVVLRIFPQIDKGLARLQVGFG